MTTQIHYTPTPWISEYCGKDRIAIFKISDKRRIATIAVKTQKMDEANAHLIAAAPELLAACKEGRICIAQNMESHCLCGKPNQARQKMLSNIDEAIAKAEPTS